ncbi:MAG: pilin [Patescibacteria group bacterium]
MKSILYSALFIFYLLPKLMRGAEFTGLENPIDSGSFVDVINGVIGFLTPFGYAVLVIIILWGGFQMMTSGGDPKGYAAGRKTLVWAAVGFAVLFLARTISDAAQEFFK